MIVLVTTDGALNAKKRTSISAQQEVDLVDIHYDPSEKNHAKVTDNDPENDFNGILRPLSVTDIFWAAEIRGIDDIFEDAFFAGIINVKM